MDSSRLQYQVRNSNYVLKKQTNKSYSTSFYLKVKISHLIYLLLRSCFIASISYTPMSLLSTSRDPKLMNTSMAIICKNISIFLRVLE